MTKVTKCCKRVLSVLCHAFVPVGWGGAALIYGWMAWRGEKVDAFNLAAASVMVVLIWFDLCLRERARQRLKAKAAELEDALHARSVLLRGYGRQVTLLAGETMTVTSNLANMSIEVTSTNATTLTVH